MHFIQWFVLFYYLPHNLARWVIPYLNSQPIDWQPVSGNDPTARPSIAQQEGEF